MPDPVKRENDIREPKAQKRMPKKVGTVYGRRKTLQTYLTPEEHRAVVALAATLGVSSSALLQMAMRAYLDAFWAEIQRRREARSASSG